MKTTQNGAIKVIFSLLVIGLLSGFFAWQFNRTPPRARASDIVPEQVPPVTVAPVADPVLRTDISFQPSPDGAKRLVMKRVHNTDGTTTYVFTVADGTGGNEQPLYSTTVTSPEDMTLPFNIWSPDNKYLFIEKSGGDVLVFKASGEEIIPGQQYIDVGSVFGAAGKQDMYHETTGWYSFYLCY